MRSFLHMNFTGEHAAKPDGRTGELLGALDE